MRNDDARRAIRAVTLGAASMLILGMTACGGDSSGPSEPIDETEQWSATLSNDQVVGADPQTGSSGSATLSWDGSRLSYTIDVSNMTEIIQAHIHGPATPSQNAPVRLWLFQPDTPTGAVNGRLVSGNVQEGSQALEGGATLAQVLGWMQNDQAHVMVHTQTFPDGEIRGHVVP